MVRHPPSSTLTSTLCPYTSLFRSSNENPLGLPQSAQQAMAQVISGLGRYPDPNGFELKAALSARYGVPAAWITLGNGSNDLLELASLADRKSTRLNSSH